MKNLFWIIPIIGMLLLFTKSCSTESTPVYKLTTHAEPAEAGTVTPGSIEADEGESLSITANANEHWVFSGWGGDHSGSQNPASIVMDRDKNVTAMFERMHYALTITIEGEGSVEQRMVSSPKTADYPYETVVELTPIPDADWYFIEWGDGLSGSETPVQITVTGPVNILAVFKTTPTVSTNPVESVTDESAQSGGNVTDDGGSDVTARGVCWSTSQNPDINDTCTSDGSGTGSFTSTLTNLSEDTEYFVRAYATNSQGTAYGEQREFRTESIIYAWVHLETLYRIGPGRDWADDPFGEVEPNVPAGFYRYINQSPKKAELRSTGPARNDHPSMTMHGVYTWNDPPSMLSADQVPSIRVTQEVISNVPGFYDTNFTIRIMVNYPFSNLNMRITEPDEIADHEYIQASFGGTITGLTTYEVQGSGSYTFSTLPLDHGNPGARRSITVEASNGHELVQERYFYEWKQVK